MKNSKKIMTKIALIPDEREDAVIKAAQRKYGVKAASEVLRMALRRFADVEGLEVVLQDRS